MNQTKSLELLERAKKVIPGGTQTLSKMYGRLPQGIAPAFIFHGKGSHIWDVDGNEYIDWSGALGPVTLGYDFFFPDSRSCSLPMPDRGEVELAEKMVEVIPCAEMVRFFKTGSDATSAAVRLCRAVTGRQMVLCCGYHGWHDWYASTLPLPRSKGTRGEYVDKVDYSSLEKLVSLVYEITPACIIMEPMNRQCPEKASKEYLQEIRNLCDQYQVPLIFDEIIMGYRYALAGGQEYYGVIPDLACYSKGMANGWPISALVGKREIMEQIAELQVSGTYFCDTISIEMALKTLKFYQAEPVIDHLWKVGDFLKKNIDDLILAHKLEDHVRLKGFGPWSSFVWNDFDEENLFMQEIFRRGIFYNRDHFAMYSHTQEDVDKTLDIYAKAFEIVRYCIEKDTIKSAIKYSMDRRLFPK